MFEFKKIREYASDKGLSLEDVARQLQVLGTKVSTRTMYNWADGVTTPNANEVAALAKLFGKPVMRFFKRTEKS